MDANEPRIDTKTLVGRGSGSATTGSQRAYFDPTHSAPHQQTAEPWSSA
jgi:hypothetical protein